ncbi:hypothetical protein CLU81_5207 [Flavobacterium sp. 9]|uniref:hypothetical protein n=1 Tax=Flavobacterium sp. 9 TaxID=2035198 RepID=UPI000C18B5AD|nr:hypothetical protein [Flavobacterium sp. 9]PIF34551.1 hypothetical protein CLU81_5207 [Flavobacterium sp. 9]
MKKAVLILLVNCVFFQGLHAQAKQRKELLLQIAALRIYADYAKKGYTAVKKGLHFISDLKNGEVDLHKDYFHSLESVNPRIKNYGKIASIISLQISIIRIYKNTCRELQNNDLFHGDELDYVERTFDRLLEHCSDSLEQLYVLTTDSKLELQDQERLARIDNLHIEMMDDYVFCQAFSREAKMLARSKMRERNDIKKVEDLNGLNSE